MTYSSLSQKRVGVQHVMVASDDSGQRIDNFLMVRLKSVPKSRLYRLLRKGEIRVNKKRILPAYRLQTGDQIRLPPLFLEERAKPILPSKNMIHLLAQRVLYEDEQFIILNKPSGWSVHGGSTVRVGVIEAMKHLYPHLPHLELGHRLDADTSGCLILGKKKRILRELHELLRAGQITKKYWAFTQGQWREDELWVNLPLWRCHGGTSKHAVVVQQDIGKASLTLFRPQKVFKQATLVEARLYTGRTHQIRVHAQSQGHPIAGDDRYGNAAFNQLMRRFGLKRLFLHARLVDFTLPSLRRRIRVEAPLDPELEAVIQVFAANDQKIN